MVRSPLTTRQTPADRRPSPQQSAGADKGVGAFDIAAQHAIVIEERHVAAQSRQRLLKRRRGCERPMEIDALGRGQVLDRKDRARIRDHRAEAARGEGRHADMVLLIGRGREAVDARRMGQALILGGERGGGHLGDHEARIQSALLHEKSRKAAHARIDEQRDAPLGNRADFRDRKRHRIGGQRHRFSVKLPPEMNSSLSGK